MKFVFRHIALSPGKKVFAMLLLTLIAVAGAFAQTNSASGPVAPAKVSAKVDSTTMTLGQRTTLHIEILKNGHEGALLDLPARMPSSRDSILSINGIEVRNIQVDSADLGNGRIRLNYEVLLQPFNVGPAAVPPMHYVIGTDTFTSEMVAMKIEPPVMPAEMVDSLRINAFRPPLSVGSKWYDWIPETWPYWVGGFLLLCLIGAGIAFFIIYKKTGKIPFVPKKRIPPYVLAKRRLEELRKKRLAENGNLKAYYTDLTDILRQYLGGRFKIYALEMTSSQIIDAVEKNEETRPFADSFKSLFRVADFVKFAKQLATTDDNIRSFKTVAEFVEATRPVEEEIPQKNKKGSPKKAEK